MKSTKWLYFLVVLFTFSACREYSVPYAYFDSKIQDYTVTFNNLSVNAVNYVWIFDDGTISTERNMTKTYKGDGEYIVILIAINEINEWHAHPVYMTISNDGKNIQQTQVQLSKELYNQIDDLIKKSAA